MTLLIDSTVDVRPGLDQYNPSAMGRKPDFESPLWQHIHLVRLRAERALVTRFNAGYGFADARLASELYLRDPKARDRMTRNSLKPRETHIEQARELDAEIGDVTARLDALTSPLTVLAGRFQLGPAERALLTVCVAYQLDRDVRDLCHALAWGRRPALFADVCQDIMPELSEVSATLRALHRNGTLRRTCLIAIGDDRAAEQTATACEVSVGRRALDWLLGDHRVAAPLHAVIRIYDPKHAFPVHIDVAVIQQLERVSSKLAELEPSSDAASSASSAAGSSASSAAASSASSAALPFVLIQGQQGSGRQAVAHRLASLLSRPLAVLPLARLHAAYARVRDPDLAHKALTEAQLRGAAVYVPGIESLADDPGDPGWRDRVLDALDHHAGVVILATHERGMPSLPLARPFHLVRMSPATFEHRHRAWQIGLAALGSSMDTYDISDATASELASRYVIGPGTIGDVVEEARAFSRATAAPIRRASIEQAVARRLSLRLGAFGTLITRRARLEDMVLPEDVIETLQDMIAMVQKRTQILEQWGYAKHLGIHRGVSALFSGVPGTGKTMAASVISSVLGLELIRIDLSAVTSKWVGETEKHLAKIFDEAQTANAMLLFDEADSLFGKRTELKSAQDRYANLEVNYVLQRMETFDGVSILTTNFESAIDQAFLRRLNFRLRFPEPEVDERIELWRRLLPPDTGIAENIDFNTLAARFVMTGGHIRNAVVRAAVIAAREGRTMKPDDLMAGAHLEYVEMGKVMPSMSR